MKAYICDCCGKVCRKIMRFDVEYNHYGNNTGSWSVGLFESNNELCLNCFKELHKAFAEIISEHKELDEVEKSEVARYEQAKVT